MIKNVLIRVPSESYGQQMVRDIIEALRDCRFKKFNYKSTQMRIQIDDVVIDICPPNRVLGGLYADLAFGLDSETTRILTRGKQEEPMHSFSTLIEWIKNELEEGGEWNEDS